jgi:hypothetical protein
VKTIRSRGIRLVTGLWPEAAQPNKECPKLCTPGIGRGFPRYIPLSPSKVDLLF